MKRFMGEDMAKPERDILAERKERFASLNEYVTKAGGWLVSLPGARVVDLQCLPGSSIPGELEARGYALVEDGETERILPTAITETFLVEGSSAPVTRRHAGIVKVRCLSFMI